MMKPTYPIAARYPAEEEWLTGVDPPALSLLTTEMKQQLLADLQSLVRREYEFVIAQQLISLIDLYTLNLTYQTLAAADFLKAMYGWSGEVDGLDREWQQQYLETMHELISLAHAQVLSNLKGE